MHFLFFWDTEQIFFGLFYWKIFRGVLKTAFYVSTGTVWNKIYFLKKSLFSIHYRTLRQRFLAFCRKFFGVVVETVFNLSIGTIKKKTQFWIFISIWDSEQEIFGILPTNFWRGCQNYILLVHRNSLRKNNFSKIVCTFYQFGTLSKNFLALFLQIFRRVVKTAFHMSIGTVTGKTYFSRTYVF